MLLDGKNHLFSILESHLDYLFHEILLQNSLKYFNSSHSESLI